VIVGAAGVIVSVNAARSAVCEALSVTRITSPENVPLSLGVPETAPVPELRVRPAGSDPDCTENT
jgi:hypothetical protein